MAAAAALLLVLQPRPINGSWSFQLIPASATSGLNLAAEPLHTPCLPGRQAVRLGFTQPRPQGLLGVTQSARPRARGSVCGWTAWRPSRRACWQQEKQKKSPTRNCGLRCLFLRGGQVLTWGRAGQPPQLSRALLFPPPRRVQPTAFFLELSLRLETVFPKA